MSERDGPHVELYVREDGAMDWRLIGGNGEQVCESSQGYRDEADTRRALQRARELFYNPVLPILRAVPE